MPQKRVKLGKEFEKSVLEKLNKEDNNWIGVRYSPKLNWTGKGRNIFDKIKSINYDHTLFKLTEKSNIIKWDIENKVTGEKREVKCYNKSELKTWKLYSETYFKMSNKRYLSKINVEDYNNFIERFYNLSSNNGFFESVIQMMLFGVSGVQIKDDFIPMYKLEFRTHILKGWKGYYRMTIQFKLKK